MKNQRFNIPDNYFEELENNILSRTTKSKKESFLRVSWIRKWSVAASLAMVLGVAGLYISSSGDANFYSVESEIVDQLDQLDSSVLEEYLDIENSEIAALNSFEIPSSISNSDLELYLID